MDPMSFVKSIETIASAVRDTVPHLKEVKFDEIFGGDDTGSATPILIAIGAAAAVGASVGLLLAPQKGAEFRAKLREKAASLRREIPANQGSGTTGEKSDIEAGQARAAESLAS